MSAPVISTVTTPRGVSPEEAVKYGLYRRRSSWGGVQEINLRHLIETSDVFRDAVVAELSRAGFLITRGLTAIVDFDGRGQE